MRFRTYVGLTFVAVTVSVFVHTPAAAVAEKSALQISKEVCSEKIGTKSERYKDCVVQYLKILKEKIIYSKSSASKGDVESLERLQEAAWSDAIGKFPRFLLGVTAGVVATQAVIDVVGGGLEKNVKNKNKDVAGSGVSPDKGGIRLKHGVRSNPRAPSVEVPIDLPSPGNFGHNIPLGWYLSR